MKIEEFIEKYDKTPPGNRQKLIESVLKLDYVPFLKKKVICENNVKSTSYVEIAGKKVFRPDSVNRTLFFTMRIIEYYTTLEFNKENPAEAYDLLQQTGLLSKLIEAINNNSSEVKEFDTIQQMVINDYYERETSLINFLDTKFEALQMVINGLEDVVAKSGFRDIKKK